MSIAASHLEVTYATSDRQVAALDGVDLTVGKGEFVTLIGPSGCGKGADVSSDGTALVRHENVFNGADVDLLKFPTPRFHEHDGGCYIGTGCVVIMRDHDSDWVNVGTYRLMLHDEQHVGLYISPGKHGRLIRERYWNHGQPCPVVVSLGQDPLLTALGGIEVPYGTSEFEVAGWVRGEPTPVIMSDLTGLPVPATGEIVIEGFLYPDDQREEGPFGEWTGYCAGGRAPAPGHQGGAGAASGQPDDDGRADRTATDRRHLLPRRAALGDDLGAARGRRHPRRHRGLVARSQRWTALDHRVGQADVRRAREAGQHGGLAVPCRRIREPLRRGRRRRHRRDDVIWALCTRCDVDGGITTLTNAWSTPLDPMSYPREKPVFNSRLVIDACRPWARRETFPRSVVPSTEYKAEIIAKWSDVLPEIAR